MTQRLYFYGIRDIMAGVKPMQPLGKIGFQFKSLLPLQLGPAGIKESGKLGIYFEQIALITGIVIEFIYQGSGIGKGFCAKTVFDFQCYFNS